MDAAENEHVVLGLTFLKYISDAFEEQHARTVTNKNESANPPSNVSDWGSDQLHDASAS
jgi:type I restriction-modification system DNA methylase subunit